MATNQGPTEKLISSDDIVAIDSDITMTDDQIDEGDQTKHEHKRTDKVEAFKVGAWSNRSDSTTAIGIDGRLHLLSRGHAD